MKLNIKFKPTIEKMDILFSMFDFEFDFDDFIPLLQPKYLDVFIYCYTNYQHKFDNIIGEISFRFIENFIINYNKYTLGDLNNCLSQLNTLNIPLENEDTFYRSILYGCISSVRTYWPKGEISENNFDFEIIDYLISIGADVNKLKQYYRLHPRYKEYFNKFETIETKAVE